MENPIWPSPASQGHRGPEAHRAAARSAGRALHANYGGGLVGRVPVIAPAGTRPGYYFWRSTVPYGTTELTDVPQLANPSLVPPHVPTVRVKSGGRQFGYWMYSLAK